MSELFSNVSQNFSHVYYMRQFALVVVLFVLGVALVEAFMSGANSRVSILYRGVLAFPIELSFFAVEMYILLVVGIPYNTVTVSIVMAIQFLICIFRIAKSGRITRQTLLENRKQILTVCVFFWVSVQFRVRELYQ